MYFRRSDPPPLHIIRLFTQYWRNDYVGIEQCSRFIREGTYHFHRELHPKHASFAKTWDNNLRQQGFAEVFTDKCIVG